MRVLSVAVNIPIYDGTISLNLSEDVNRARLEESADFGEWHPIEGLDGLCASAIGRFGLFFDRRYLSCDTVAHEIFHATHRIMQSYGIRFDADNHEAFAYLNGWLTKWVYSQLADWEVRIP